MLPMIFNDNVGKTNISDKINKGAVILYWSKKNDINALDIYNMGYRLINMTSGLYYVVGGSSSINPSTFDVFYFQGDYSKTMPIDMPVGGNLSIWCDHAGESGGVNDGGDYIVAQTAQYIADFGIVMKTQKKKIAKSLQEAVTVPSGGIVQIPVDISSIFTVKTLLNAYILSQTDLKYLGFSNVSCETDPITGVVKNGTINVTMLNAGTNAISLTVNNSISIEFL